MGQGPTGWFECESFESRVAAAAGYRDLVTIERLHHQHRRNERIASLHNRLYKRTPRTTASALFISLTAPDTVFASRLFSS
jgi:hypothetical protein